MSLRDKSELLSLSSPRKKDEVRKVFTSLIIVIVVLTIAPAAASADSIVLGPPNVHRLHVAINSNGNRHVVVEWVPNAVSRLIFPWRCCGEEGLLDLVGNQQFANRVRAC